MLLNAVPAASPGSSFPSVTKAGVFLALPDSGVAMAETQLETRAGKLIIAANIKQRRRSGTLPCGVEREMRGRPPCRATRVGCSIISPGSCCGAGLGR